MVVTVLIVYIFLFYIVYIVLRERNTLLYKVFGSLNITKMVLIITKMVLIITKMVLTITKMVLKYINFA
ncbi:hypothetical protein COI59_26320 [Bacillus toyonensis]|nr:hypothetical protein COI59_26320 [Bacillus toyonensis]